MLLPFFVFFHSDNSVFAILLQQAQTSVTAAGETSQEENKLTRLDKGIERLT